MKKRCLGFEDLRICLNSTNGRSALSYIHRYVHTYTVYINVPIYAIARSHFAH
jgi:hypothetical protein